jgi:hypothetical protein
LLLLGVIYALVSARFTVGPPWLLLAVALVGASGTRWLHWRGSLLAGRVVVLGLLALLTAAVAFSAYLLFSALLAGRAQAGDLLLSSVLLWASNLLIFALWYWELDGGGPHRRRPGAQASSDFVFPQMVADRAEGWTPEFVDYVFLAFNTCTAFSPTDTMVLARRAKLLMMLQSIISLTTIAVFVARAINTFPS